MCEFLTTLGLRADPTSITQAPNYAAALIITNYILANIVFTPAWTKRSAKLLDPVSPRDGVDKYGEDAIKKGWVTRQKLEMIKRQAAAHSNGIENFPLFFGTVILALFAGLPNATINGVGVSYTIFRTIYFLAYSFTESEKYVFIRPLCYAGATLSCFSAIYWSGQVFNSV